MWRWSRGGEVCYELIMKCVKRHFDGHFQVPAHDGSDGLVELEYG